MFYENIAAFGPIRISIDVILDATDFDPTDARPPARVPDRLLSTR